jgi:hypothetical protein
MIDKDLFAKRLKSLGIDRQVDAAVIVSRAQEIIDKELGQRGKDNLRVISYKKGVLKIAASSGAWAAECRKVEAELNKLRIHRVYFTQTTQNFDY